MINDDVNNPEGTEETEYSAYLPKSEETPLPKTPKPQNPKTPYKLKI